VLADVYAALYELIVLQTSFGSSVGATFWPGAGVTVSVLLLRPRREWPVYVAAISLAEFAMDIKSDYAVAVAAGMAVANVAEPLLAATLLRRWLPRAPDLSNLRQLALAFAAAAVAGPMLGAVVGSVWPWVVSGDPIWPRLGRWYLGDALGVIVVAPLLVSVMRPPDKALLRFSESWTLVVLGVVAVFALPWEFAATIGLPFIVIPALALVGMRMGTRAAAAGMLFVGILVETVTALGGGPFAGAGPFTGLLAAQMYLATCAISALTAAALMAGLASSDERALHDPLTGLANRRLLMDRLEVAFRHLTRTEAPVGLVLIDLDGFKEVNDRHGHHVGDHVLTETAARVGAAVRDHDTVARLGGDEFVVLADGLADRHALEALVDRLHRSIEQPIATSAGPVRVGASIGCASTADPDADPEELLRRADRAMYAAKRTSVARAGGAAVPVAG
jgi:diguanylate cyclase (GGDEF)-like protein